MSSLRSPLSRGFVSRRRHILSSPVRRISSDAQKPQAENSAWSTKRLGTLFAAAGLGVGIAGYAAWTLTSRRIIALDAKPSKPSHRIPDDPPVEQSDPILTYPSSPIPPPKGPSDSSKPQDLTPPPESAAQTKTAAAESEAEDTSNSGAYNPETGEINWECPCLGGMAHGPCGMQFREAFSCFVFSEQEPKGIDCIEKFRAMQDCFREHPDVYGEELMDDDELESAPSEGLIVTDPPAAIDIANTPPEPALPSSPTSSESTPSSSSKPPDAQRGSNKNH